ncbi:hypothetical protein HDU67_005845 [Dinochytrium kinnereticum]|nr:hypothetical protein HDU67_005845 [Dinochytrium kinnereticum]
MDISIHGEETVGHSSRLNVKSSSSDVSLPAFGFEDDAANIAKTIPLVHASEDNRAGAPIHRNFCPSIIAHVVRPSNSGTVEMTSGKELTEDNNKQIGGLGSGLVSLIVLSTLPQSYVDKYLHRCVFTFYVVFGILIVFGSDYYTYKELNTTTYISPQVSLRQCAILATQLSKYLAVEPHALMTVKLQALLERLYQRISSERLSKSMF